MAIGMMRAPVLNQPRNGWYQKRKHRRIPKRAESKKYLDAYFTDVNAGIIPPAGYSRALFNERSIPPAIERYGFVGVYTSVGEKAYGAVSPDIVGGVQIVRFATQAPATNNVVIRFGSDGVTQVPGVNTINLTIQSFGALTLTWSSSRYVATSTPFWNFVSNPANVGRVFGINGFPAMFSVPSGEIPDWNVFDDELELQAIIDHFVLAHGVVLPDNWTALTFAERIQWAKDNIG